MACLVKDTRLGKSGKSPKSPYYICCWTDSSGHRWKRTTRQTDKDKAWTVCLAMIETEKAIGSRAATEPWLRKFVNDTLTRIGERELSNPTIKEQLDTWIANKKGSVSKATALAYEYARDLLLEFLGPRAGQGIRSLQKSDAIAFRDHLRNEGRTPGTVNTVVKKYLTGPFESARKEGLIDYNPFVAVDALKSKTVAKDVFSPEQVGRLIQVTRETDWEGAILVGYTTGMRLQDVANLRWSSVDVKSGLIAFVQKKGEKRTVIGLHPDLEDWITRRPVPDDPEANVFPSLANRSGAGRNGLSKAFERIMQRAGVCGKVLRERTPQGKGRMIQSLTFHSFRHGAATAVFKNAALKDIARRVTAHTSRGVVDRYIHEDIEAIREATNLIPRLPKPS